jgi:hypothetical protein
MLLTSPERLLIGRVRYVGEGVVLVCLLQVQGVGGAWSSGKAESVLSLALAGAVGWWGTKKVQTNKTPPPTG